MFSVVVCTYNRAGLVSAAIDSVLAQTWDDFELLVVDDGSDDHTAEVLASYRDSRLHPLHRPNGGLSAARNTGIEQATGRFVAFLDDDDEASPGWLEGLARGVDDRSGFTSCTCTLVSPDRSVTTPLAAFPHEVYPDILGVFMAGTFALDRSIISDVGGYATDIRVSHQTELLLRALPVLKARGMTAVLCDEPLVAIERRDPADRPLSQPGDLLDGAEYLIQHHGTVLAANPIALANTHAIAGVSAAQLGERRRSRRHLRRAAATAPRSPKHLARFAVSLVPPLARRAWRLPG